MLLAEAQRNMEVRPMSNTRRQNRETFVRLFQGFVNEYGAVAGEKIIKHLVDNAGGLRLWIPGNDIPVNQSLIIHGDPLCTHSACFRRLWRSTCREFGQASGRAIMNKIVVEFGGRRVSFPDYEDIYKWERNEKMKNQFTGNNIDEIAARWGMSPLRALQIVTGEDELGNEEIGMRN